MVLATFVLPTVNSEIIVNVVDLPVNNLGIAVTTTGLRYTSTEIAVNVVGLPVNGFEMAVTIAALPYKILK